MKKYISPEFELIRFSLGKLMTDDANFDPSSKNIPKEEVNPGLDD